MPPKKGDGKKLSDQQIALLTDWVKMGAPYPKETGQKMTTRAKGTITDEDRQWWAFQPLAKVEPPAVEDDGWSANGIDRFIFQKLRASELKPAPHANPEQLARRIYFDLTGLPPTPGQTDAFVQSALRDPRAASESLIDSLLASPRYGEHWARHWLDLARYAESDGYKIDAYRPHAWRYRDYVIQSLNADKPYDRFVQEQLAGDELFPGDVEALAATGFLRLGIYEYNNRDVALQWSGMLNDITDVTADVFLGMGVQCARCHDHKFDPILQKDYFRWQAFFAPLLMPEDVRAVAPEQQADYDAKLKVWEEKTADIRAQIAAIEDSAKEKAANDAIKKFPPETQAILNKSVDDRTPGEEQIADLAFRQVTYEWDHLFNHLKSADKDKLVVLQKQLAAFDKDKPADLPVIPSVSDVGSKAPPVFIPKKPNLGEIAPGFLTVLDAQPAVIKPVQPESTGRRAALARWLTQPENPLTARVIVNRVWQYHFGRGLVATASDFGKLGEPPSHPELLDWLTRRFIADGWSLKKLHRLILLSSTYHQSAKSLIAETARIKDPENRLLSRANTRRLDAEQIRDAILSVTGELKLATGGPSIDASVPYRSIFTKVLRNSHDPLLEVFDSPDGFNSMAERHVTTTPTQSLLMINSSASLKRAQAFAARLSRDSSADEERCVIDAYRLVFGRTPSDAERQAALAFIDRQAQNIAPPSEANEPAPFISEKMTLRDGRAAVFTPGTPMDRLTIPDQPAFPGGDFTVESFIVMKSVYDDGQVRTIAAQWDGDKAHPGWAFGVTGRQSRYKPQTLVLLLRGAQPWSEKDPVEPIFSGLRIEIGKPYFVAVSVQLEDPSEQGVTFYAKDLSNDDEPMQIATVAHRVTAGIRSTAPLRLGARADDAKNLFDGLLDDVRLSNAALPAEQLLLTSAAITERTVGYWKFEKDPGVYADSSGHHADIAPRIIEAPKIDPRAAALADFCQVLLNSNEFLYLD
jgi:Protein of unknown function (DUF1553)/Protein of unknown function (DUF1549)/Concanavalin A-like lectin/glucanases superfamily